MDWATLFERAPADVTVEEVRDALTERREGSTGGATSDEDDR